MQQTSAAILNTQGFLMNTKHLLALAAMITVQAYAAGPAAPANSAPPGTFSGPLTATPDPANPRQIFFKQALSGDTKTCVIDISYGEPGALPNNDGPTHLNGLSSLDRVRTYKVDGSYTFTAKAVSGCTGSARVSFRIGSGKQAVATIPAGGGVAPGSALAPASAPAPVSPLSTLPTPTMGSTNPGLTIAHTVITKLDAPIRLPYGAPLTVNVLGTGDSSKCHTGVDLIKLKMDGSWDTFQRKPAQVGKFPRVSNFSHSNTDTNVPLERGHYMVHLSIAEPDQVENMACTKNLAVPGQNTMLYIGEDIAK
jgi:hypothetical protein